MNKFLALGLSVDEVILRSTWNPAREIGQEQLGNLSVGSPADVAVLRLEQGEFGFLDAYGARLRGNRQADLRDDPARRQDRLRAERPVAARLDHAARRATGPRGDPRWDGNRSSNGGLSRAAATSSPRRQARPGRQDDRRAATACSALARRGSPNRRSHHP